MQTLKLHNNWTFKFFKLFLNVYIIAKLISTYSHINVYVYVYTYFGMLNNWFLYNGIGKSLAFLRLI